MDKELLIIVGLAALVFLFILPPWAYLEPALEIESAALEDSSLSFSASYQAPSQKSCFLVAYGPFRYDKPGHEAGNNIYVLGTRTGTVTDTLALRVGDSLESLRIEMWCDNDKIIESVVPL